MCIISPPARCDAAQRRTILALIATLAFTTTLAMQSRAENWPAWRGPTGMGVSSDRDVPMRWGAKENVRWRVSLPDRGNSTPIVWKDRVFITQAIERDNRRTIMCFARSDGKLLWQSGATSAEQEPTNGQNPYCSASPVTDGQRVIAFFGSPGLYCYDLDGRELWHRELGQVDSWQGSGSSPIIYKDLCILNFGPGTEAALVGCDKRTGEIVWRVKAPKPSMLSFGWAGFGPTGAGPNVPAPSTAPSTQPAPIDGADAKPPATRPAYNPRAFADAMWAADPRGRGGFMGSWSTPLVLRVADRDQLIVVHPTRVTAYDPVNGKVLWYCTGLPDQAFASPVASGDLLIAAGHLMTGGTRVTAVRLGSQTDGSDITTTNRLWQIKLPKDCVGSPVISGKHAYFVTDFGTILCLDLAIGRKLAEHRLSGEGSRGGSWSSLALVNGTLIAFNQSGETFVIEPSPALKILNVNSIGDETTCASPAVASGDFFLRSYAALWCFGTRAPSHQ